MKHEIHKHVDIHGNIEREVGLEVPEDHVWDDEEQECSCRRRPCPTHEPYAHEKRVGRSGGV